MSKLTIKYLFFALLWHAGAMAQPLNEEIARVEFLQTGCFHADMETLIIYAEQGILKAKLASDSAGQRITPRQLDYFYQFINELKKMNGDGRCTTVDKYVVYINKTSIVKRDATCEWSGFERLRKKLFAP